MRIKAVLFDIDGTLVDSNDSHVRAWIEAFKAIGADVDASTIHDQIGKGTDMLVPALMPGLSQTEQDRLGEAHGAAFKANYLERVQPFAGARDLLARVRQSGRKVVLASSASRDELEHYVDLLDARGIVEETTSADDVEHSKPAPDIFAAALRKAAPASPDEVLVVGDSPYDVEAAASCGIATVALRSGKFSDDRLRDAGAIAIYDGAASLLADFEASPLNG